MPYNTISAPETADSFIYQLKAPSTKSVQTYTVQAGHDWVILAVRVHADHRAEDYATLLAAIDAVAGTYAQTVLMDVDVPDTIPEGCECQFLIHADMRGVAVAAE